MVQLMQRHLDEMKIIHLRQMLWLLIVMEMSHRSKVYDNIIKEAEKDLRDLLNIPDNYKVLFLQGGASQFSSQSIKINLDISGLQE